MDVLELITKEEIREFFCKDWMKHDGLWFAQCVKEIGIEKTNLLNMNGIRIMAEAEIRNLIILFNNGNRLFKNYSEFQEFLVKSIDFVRPDFMKFTFVFYQNKILEIDFRKCWAYEGVKKSGFIGQYECAVVMRLKSWLNFLGINYSLSPDFKNCLMHEYGTCTYRFEFFIF